MQMGIHRFRSRTQSMVPECTQPVPVSVQGVEVAPMNTVARVRFNKAVDRHRFREGEFVVGRPEIFRQGIDAEDLQVDQLIGILRRAVLLGDRPEKAAGFGVLKMIHEIPVGPGRQFEIRGLPSRLPKAGILNFDRPFNLALPSPALLRPSRATANADSRSRSSVKAAIAGRTPSAPSAKLNLEPQPKDDVLRKILATPAEPHKKTKRKTRRSPLK